MVPHSLFRQSFRKSGRYDRKDRCYLCATCGAQAKNTLPQLAEALAAKGVDVRVKIVLDRNDMVDYITCLREIQKSLNEKNLIFEIFWGGSFQACLPHSGSSLWYS